MTNEQQHQVEVYFESILNRFYNMEQAEVDLIGIKKATEMVEGYIKTKTITPGEFKYIYDRTHPLGALPKYNKTGKKWGLMRECPVQLFVTYIIDWRIPHPQLRSQLNKNHEDFYLWYSDSDNLNRPKVSPVYRNLFKEE